MQSDRRLVDLVREGNESAFEEIVRRYRRPLDRFAASIVGAGADDVTQDSFRKALEALRHAEADVELRPWLFRIVRNTALNDLRDRPPAAAELVEELVAGGRSAAAEAEQRAELQDLTAHLRALPENQRAALVMRELEGMGHEEIAAALGISDGAARQAIARARTAVRSGFGALVPLPLLRALTGGGDGVTGAGAAAGAGSGAIAAGAGTIGVGAFKVGLATVVVAGTIGAGVAIERHGGGPGPDGRTGVASAPDAARTAGSRTTPSPSSPPARTEPSDGSSGARHEEGGTGRPSHHRHLGGRAERVDNGTRLVPIAQQTTVVASEPGGRPEQGDGPGPSHHGGGRDGSGGGEDVHQGPGGGGHQSPHEDGSGDREGSGGTGGSSRGEDSGQEASGGGRTSGSSNGGDGSDGPGDGSVEPATTQTSGIADGGSSSGGGDSGSSDDGGRFDTESGTATEPLTQSVGEPLPSASPESSS
jgi:RNA polymerase sigma factor (sigma-70 family)